MSSVATARVTPSSRISLIAFALALITVVTWFIAATVNDALFLAVAVVGAGTVALGAKARKEARRGGSKGRLALAAMIVGGLPAALVVVYSAVYGISKIV
jgi:hypothetical protein